MNSVYKQLVKDIDNEKKEYIKRQLSLLKEDIDNVFKLDGILKTVEDTLIVISNFEENVKMMLDETKDETMYHDLNTLLQYCSQYFKYIDYNGDKVSHNLLSNGMYYNDIEKEIIQFQKACKLQNKVSFFIKIFSFLILLTSGALFFCFVFDSFKFALLSLFSGIFMTVIFYGFAEIIQILHDIRRKAYKLEK